MQAQNETGRPRLARAGEGATGGSRRAGSDRLRSLGRSWQERARPVAAWLADHLWIAIPAYFALQALIRIALSGNLEPDEAQFVSRTGFALGFDASHPPLYSWLVTLALMLTGGAFVPALALVKNALLAATFLLAFDLPRRLGRTGQEALLAPAALAFLPQIVWMSQVTLAHSVLVAFAVVATLHASVVWLLRPGWRAQAWLGVAIACGFLAKYNFGLFLIAFAAAVASLPTLRWRLEWRRLWLAGALALVLVVPHAVWAALHFETTTERLGRLYEHAEDMAFLDLPHLGIDGLASLLVAALAWGGPLALVWWLALRGKARPVEEAWALASAFASACLRASLLALGLLALFVLAGDVHKMDERYLTPLALPAVFWLVLARPLRERARETVVCLAAVLMLAAALAIPLTVLFGRNWLAYPYVAIAEELARAQAGSVGVLASREDIAANLALRLPNGHLFSEADDAVAIVWKGGGDAPERLIRRLPADFAPLASPRQLAMPYANWSGAQARIGFQHFARADDAQADRSPGAPSASPR
jgi:4-amino-4-deoxy-L-arabinose transferase-like glycosyltransferase